MSNGVHATSLVIRLLRPDDSITELTELLHRAYRPLADRGMNYVAATQDDATTRRRISGGECYLALLGTRTVGTITLHPPRHDVHTPWYCRPDVATFQQFAVEPSLQNRGVGSALLTEVERRAGEAGHAELAFNTAENASELIEFYARRGYRFIEHVRWPHAKYRSVVMSKALTPSKPTAPPGLLPR